MSFAESRQIRSGYSSKAFACKNRDHMTSWAVMVRLGNYSAFNGYHFTPSDYSLVRCAKCGRMWRSKGAYVAALPDETEGPI